MIRNNDPQLDLAWAPERWSDPLSGSDVVRLSPESKEHFRNNYFRVNMFTSDGRYAVLMSQEEIPGPTKIWRLDLATGQTEELGAYRSLGLTSWGISYHQPVLYVINNDSGSPVIEIINLETGARRTVTPAPALTQIVYAIASADDRYIYAAWAEKKRPPGMSRTEYTAMMGSDPGRNVMYRVCLETGKVETVFEGTDWWMGHANPNPVDPGLFMCCQEGFIWTDKYPKPADFQRVRVYDLAEKKWLDLSRKRIHVSHETWSRDGRRIYGHSNYRGHHAIGVFSLDSGYWTHYAMKNGSGRSCHVVPAPNETFLVGGGHNFGKNNQHEAGGGHGAGDNPWSYDGVGSDSPGEVIWKYELPAETVITGEDDLSGPEDLARVVEAQPEKCVRVTPLCTFRSRMKYTDKPIRLESNARATPDSRWAVFQSCNADGIHEVWAARVPDGGGD